MHLLGKLCVLATLMAGTLCMSGVVAQPVYDDTYYRVTIWDHQGRLDQEHDYQRQVFSVQQAFIQR